MIQRVKGTQDFLDLRLYNFFINAVKSHLKNYNFKEISTPILEPTELFKRSLGLATDIISKEMYMVMTEHESEEQISLRPEMTASFLRAFLNANIVETPWKVFGYGPVFRHERPQKGRFREFHQCNIEVIGQKSIFQDAHFIKMIDRLFHENFNLNNYALLINFLGCANDRQEYKKILVKFLDQVFDKICANCKERRDKNPLRVLDCKVEADRALYQSAPFISDHICESCKKEWKDLQETLHAVSVSFTHNPMLVRGLDYYQKTVFEFVSPSLGAQSAFCAGGRYEQLAQELGSKTDYPSIGAAIGIERSLILLEASDKLLFPVEPRLHIILPMQVEQVPLSLMLADELLAQGLCTDIILEESSMKSMMRKANKLGAAFVLIIGSEEQQNRMVTVKNMINGQELKVRQNEVVAFLKEKI